MNVEIKRLNHTGEGIGKINNKVIFIPKTIPGDIVETNEITEYKTYLKATLKDIKKKSSKRINITCPYYDKCGGCQLMGLSYEEQLKYKQDKVIDIFKKYAQIDINPKIIPSTSKINYRNKITLQVKDGKLGLFEINTNNLIQIDKCLLIKDKMNEIIPILKTKINLSNVEQIIIKQFNDKLMITFIGTPDKIQVINNLKNKVSSIYINDALIYGQKKLKENLNNYIYNISPKSFFQINHDQTINLYNKIKEYLGPNNNNILDLYCGAASIGIYVSNYCKKITGIECNASSINDAKENIGENKLTNIEVIKGNVGDLIHAKNTYEAIILDPPRSGLDKKTKNTLLKINSPKLIYVSCDPITLARDIKDLSQSYKIEDITLVDMFPNTYHIESVVLLYHI